MIDKSKLAEELKGRPGMGLVNIDELIEDAVQDFLDFTHHSEEELTTRMTSCIKDLACYRFNTRGVEGLTAESQSGVSTSYADDIPARIKRKMRAFRRLNYSRRTQHEH